MNPRAKTLLALAAGALATACNSVPTKKFTFDVIDGSERPKPALIVVDDDWVKAWDANQVVNVTEDDELTLDVAVPSSTVEITVVPLTVANKKVANKPMSRKDATDVAGMTDEVRTLKLNDPQRHLFILLPKPRS
jgi:hypothetical protein